VRDGEAVALCMMAAAYVALGSGRLGEEDVRWHERLLTRFGLPTSGAFELAELESAWRLDKKYRGEPRFVLLRRMGEAEYGVRVPRPLLVEALRRLAS
jgi:3-dehydroquinate synthetase